MTALTSGPETVRRIAVPLSLKHNDDVRYCWGDVDAVVPVTSAGLLCLTPQIRQKRSVSSNGFPHASHCCTEAVFESAPVYTTNLRPFSAGLLDCRLQLLVQCRCQFG